jgi:hypothetical protein
LAFALFIGASSRAAEKIRVYEFGENDPGAMLGGEVIETQDSQVPPVPGSDVAGGADSVPLFAEFLEEPTYVEGRGGPGTFAIDFDGEFDRLTSPAFDPRNFNGPDSFNALSQAWLKPDSAKQGQQQNVWSLGNDNGGVGITADGFWQIIASSSIPDTASTTPVAFDEWTHVAIYRTGNFARLYVNGSLVVSGANFWNGVGLVTVGNRTSEVPSTSLAHYDGAIDDFAISGFGFDGVFGLNPAEDIDFFADLVITGVPGDVDQDGDADQDDYNIWSTNVGFNSGLGSGDPSTLLIGDLDQNGRVNYFDFIEIVAAARAEGNQLVLGSIPEPSALILVAAAALCCAVGTRKSRLRGGRRMLACAAAVIATSTVSSSASADVIVADDFFYNQPTKALGPGGGFSLQDYGGGQNGPAGGWGGRWVSVGNAIITGPDHMVEPERFQSLVTTGLSLAELNRDYSFEGLAGDQTLYFGVRMRTGAVDELPEARLNINPVETGAAVGIGFSQGTFAAQLGDQVGLGFNLVNEAEFHTLIGKVEFNVNASGEERLTVWLDPTGVEAGADSTMVTSDVVSGLDEFAGNLELYLDVDVGSPVWWDDVAVGTTWEDAATVNVPRLDLRINTDTGRAQLMNNTAVDIPVNFLELQSARNSLNVSGWSSLADQGLDAGAWQENVPSIGRLTETNFTGSSVLPAGQTWRLGNPFTPRRAEDIVARAGSEDGLLNLINVEYVTGMDELLGDYNASGLVEQADLDLVLLNWGQSATPPPANWTNDLPMGTIDQAELDKVLLGWGNSAALAGLSASAVPEPAGLATTVLCASILATAHFCRRRG